MALACGTSSPPARVPVGPDRDEGSGILARASNKDALAGLLGERDPADDEDPAGTADEPGGEVRRGPWSGLGASSAAPAGNPFGGSGYGGTLYGGYRFDWRGKTWSRRPPMAHGRGYRTMPIGDKSSVISGRVLWPRAPAPATALVAPDSPCPAVPNDTLSVDRRGRVAGAVVYLENIRRGRPGALAGRFPGHELQIGGLLRRRRCRFIPHVQIVSPVGALLRLENGDATAQRWTGKIGARMAFIASIGRAGTRVMALAEPGFIEVRSGDQPGTAWVVVAAHPYYTITDEEGRFRLDGVPPGTYTLVVWHEPVVRASATDRPNHAIKVRRSITVKAGRDRAYTIRLPRVE